MIVRQVFGCNYIVDEAHAAIVCKKNLGRMKIIYFVVLESTVIHGISNGEY